MRFDISKLFKSLTCAFHGLKQVIHREQNFRLELTAAIFVIALGLFFKINTVEWIWILASITLVLSLELLNTSIERLTDLVVDKRKTGLARQAKDIAAAGVLITVFQSIIAGLVIFGPKVINLL